MDGPLTPELLARMDAYWRAANYLSVGQIYLYDNPLLREPLSPQHIKPRLLGHWGTTPGQNFIYLHLNRLIRQHDLNMFYVAGPGHGGPALVANTYLEGTYSELYPDVSQEEGTITTPFDMTVLNDLDRFHLAADTIDRLPQLAASAGYAKQHLRDKLMEHREYITRYGEDLPEIRNWRWLG